MTETHAVTATNIERVMASLVSTEDAAAFDFTHATELDSMAHRLARAMDRLCEMALALDAEITRRR